MSSVEVPAGFGGVGVYFENEDEPPMYGIKDQGVAFVTVTAIAFVAVMAILLFVYTRNRSEFSVCFVHQDTL
jgi:hypothetical protein